MIEISSVNRENYNFDKWDSLNFENNQQTLFSTNKFLNYHEKQNLLYYFEIYCKKKLIAVIPLTVNNNIAISHSGATYGGFMQFEKLSPQICREVYEKFTKYLVSKKINEFLIKFPPYTFIKHSKNDLNNFFAKQMTVKESEETSFVNLAEKDFSTLDSINIRRNHKRDIKFYRDNYSVNSKIKRLESQKEYVEYYKILEENLKKFNKKPTHSLRDLSYLLHELPNFVWIEALIYKGEIVSGITNFKLNQFVNYFFYGSNSYSAQLKGSMKYLYFVSLQNRKKEGYKYVDFGIDSKQTEKPNESLRRFKDGFNVYHENRYLYHTDLNY